MRAMVSAAAIALCLASGAARGDILHRPIEARPVSGGDRLALVYGHEADITGPNGKTEKLWVRSNHTFLWQGTMGESGHGTWSVRGGQICLVAFTEADQMGRPHERTTPAPARCAELREGKGPGAEWSQANDRGEPIKVHIN